MADPNLFFSVLNELARTAKQAMPLEQWQRYLAPGRVLERGGVRFPLRADEVKYGPLARIVQEGPRDYDLPSEGPISPVDLHAALQDIGTGQNMIRETPTYPEFRTLSPAGAPRGPWQDRATSGNYMSYKDQYQLPGPKLGQAEELTVLPGSDFVPSTSHFGGQPGLVSWSRVTRRPILGSQDTPRSYAPEDFSVEHTPGSARESFDVTNSHTGEIRTFWAPDPATALQKATQSTGWAGPRPMIKGSGPTATHLEEIQSDWHQRAREEGYQIKPSRDELYRQHQEDLVRRVVANGGDITDPVVQDAVNRMARDNTELSLQSQPRGVPPAPYKDTYPELELRKGIARALAQGDDYVTWTTGDQQADRWGQALRNSVDEIHYTQKPNGKYLLVPFKDGRGLGIDERLDDLTVDQVEDTVGKDIAEKIKNGEGLDPHATSRHGSPVGIISGDNLTVGGAGMRLFYDRKVKEAAERLAKQYGGEVTRVKIPGQGTWNEHEVDYHFGSVAVPEREFNRNLDRARAALGNPEIEPDHPLAQLERAYHDYHEFAGGYSDYSEQQANEALRHYAEAKDELTRSFNNQPQEVHALRLTPQMKERVLRAGLPLFSAGALAGVGTGLYAGPGSAAEEPSPPMPEASPPVPQHLATGGLTNPLPGLPNPLEAYGYAGSRLPRHRPPRAALPNLHPGMPAEAPAPDYEKLLGNLEGTGGAPPALRPVDYGGGEGNPGLSAAPPGAAGPAPATELGGTPGGWRTALKTAEGGPQPGQPVAGSTALGPYRFTEGTWADVARAHPELGLTPDGRTNDTQADLAVTALWRDHAKALLALNEPPTDANLRTLHFLGQGDGLSFLYAATAAPGDPAVAHVSPRAAAANRAIFYDDKGQPRTVGQVYGLLSRGFGGSTFAGQYLTPDAGLPPPG